MKNLTNVLVFVVLIFLSASSMADEDEDKSAAISGTVFMPQVKKERRTFRGRIYRNRLATAKPSKNDNETLQSSFIDVIISAQPLSFRTDTKPLPDAKILQLNAAFVPHVLPVTPGTEVQFINRDRFFHNVFSITPGSRFNIGRKPTDEVERRTITKIGEIKLFCDIHAQMNAVILCLSTPFFTRVHPDGRYHLPDLPKGLYRIKVYHPDMQEVSEVIEIKAGESLIRNYNLSR